MHHLRRSTAVLVAVLVIAGCTAQASPSPSSPVSPSSSEPSAVPSGASGESSAPSGETPSGEPAASEDLGGFTCDLPVVEDATVALANITDVRVGTHEGYDRVVFEFAQGLPEISLDRASPPFTQDASGLPIDVTGSSFLQLTMRGGSKQTDEGTSSYDGPTDFSPGYDTLLQLVEGGDFERQSTWFLGLPGEACVRVVAVAEEGGSTLLVIDLEH
jgi:hypothetical protein